MINRANERVNPAVFHAEPAQIFQRFFFAKIDKFAFDPCADYECFGAEMMLRVILDKIDKLRGGVCLIIFDDVGEIGFRHIAGEKSRL